MYIKKNTNKIQHITSFFCIRFILYIKTFENRLITSMASISISLCILRKYLDLLFFFFGRFCFLKQHYDVLTLKTFVYVYVLLEKMLTRGFETFSYMFLFIL